MFISLAFVTTRLVALGTVAMLGTGSASVLAHEKFRIVGTVVKVHATQLDVKGGDGQTYQIDMDAKTRVTRNKKAVVQSQLAAGRSVVIDALGHDMFDLVAVEIQLVK